MNAGARLAAFGAGLVLVFAGAFAVAGAVVPASAVADWQQRTADEHADPSGEAGGGHGTGTGGAHQSAATGVRGLGVAQDGFLLGPVTAPATTGTAGTLAFRVLDDHGQPVTDFAVSHEKRLHLIVVRTDGTRFRHVHPTMSAAGVWSIDWHWPSAGSYRVLADFLPTGEGAAPVTLSRTVDVAGALQPSATSSVRRSARVDGFEARLTGDLHAADTSELKIEIRRDGRPVTTLQPYLGAYGHLVALRSGDLGYLHVHAEGDEPTAGNPRGQTAGPTISFATTAPTAGRYLLYLDFRVDRVVRTATFVLDAS